MNQAELAFLLTAVIMAATVANALADVFMQRMIEGRKKTWRVGMLCSKLPFRLHKGLPDWSDLQWAWHLAKWVHFYLPLICLGIWAEYDLFNWVFVTAGALMAWRLIYNGLRKENAQ